MLTGLGVFAMSDLVKDCQQAIEIASEASTIAGFIFGVIACFVLDQLWSFARPFVMSWMHDQCTKRDLECHCDECEERPRRGIDN